MKKFLSLVMALALTVSLVTVSAGAKDFTDKSSISYGEAVDVISALGVVDGYSDGSFNPSATLTRGAAAKIICNLILGPTTAGALGVNAAPFKDVPVSNVFAGYIAYCSQQGIINGYADGTFKPTATVTGYQFMKMLLGALGYDGSIEGFTGANWTVAVAKLAVSIGLDDGNDGFVGSKAMTREEAALYAYNALNATMVEYDTKGSTIVVGGVEIKQGASKASDVVNNASTETIKNDNLMQFAEKYFSKLVKTTGTDDFARPATTWKYKNDKVGTYADKADLTYSAAVKSGTIYTDLGLTQKINATVYVDGVEQLGSFLISKGDATKYVSGTAANGLLQEVYYDSDADTIDIIMIHTYLAQVTSVKAATSSADRTIVLSAKSSAPANFGSYNTFETEDFAEDDMVLYTFANNEVKTVAAADSIDGAYTSYTGTDSVVVADTTYKASSVANTVGTSYAGNLKDTVTLYLDSYGYVIGMEQSKASSSNYAYVLDVGHDGVYSGDTTYYAKLLFSDGTTKSVVTTKNYQVGGYDDTSTTGVNESTLGWKGLIVSYTVNSDEKYTLTNKVATADLSNVNFQLEKSRAGINTDATATTYETYANSNTAFIVITGTASDPIYKAYTGIANIPTIKAASGNAVDFTYYCKNTGMVTFAVIDARTAAVNSSSDDVIFIKGNATASLTTNSNSSYYALDAVVNDSIVTVKVSAAVASAKGLVGAGAVNGLFTAANYDGYDVITSLTASLDVYTGSTTGKLSGDTIKLNGSFYSYSNDVVVYFINNDGNLEKSSVSSIGDDSNDLVYFIYKDGEVSSIFVKSVASAATTYAVGTVSNLTFSTTSATAGFAASLPAVTAGTTVYVKADAGYSVANGAITLASTSTTGVYSFTMPSRAVVAADFTVTGALTNVSLSHAANNFTVNFTSPSLAGGENVTVAITKDGAAVVNTTVAAALGTSQSLTVPFTAGTLTGQVFTVSLSVTSGGQTYTFSGNVFCG